MLISAALLVSVAALVVRFVKSSGEERLQLKWCATAALLLVVVFVASIWVNSAAVNVLQSLAFLCLYTAIAIAVLKYRLYDIDRIISRTLAYAIVTGLLVGYTRAWCCWPPRCCSSNRRLLCRVHAGGRGPVQPAAIAGAAGGGPWVQPARYDADQMVAAFAARLKDAVDLNAVQGDLASVVQRALSPLMSRCGRTAPVTSRVLSSLGVVADARSSRARKQVDARRQPLLPGPHVASTPAQWLMG